jgi:hypothetical protein
MQIELVPTSEPAAPPQSADSTDPGAAASATSRWTVVLSILGLAALGGFVIAIGSQGRQTPPPVDEIDHPPAAEAAAIGPVLGATTARSRPS